MEEVARSAIGKMLSQGAKVIVVDNEGALKKVIEECKELDSEGRLDTFVGNSCSEKGIIDIMNYVKDKVKNIDGFVHGACHEVKRGGVGWNSGAR